MYENEDQWIERALLEMENMRNRGQQEVREWDLTHLEGELGPSRSL